VRDKTAPDRVATGLAVSRKIELESYGGVRNTVPGDLPGSNIQTAVEDIVARESLRKGIVDVIGSAPILLALGAGTSLNNSEGAVAHRDTSTCPSLAIRV